jgi:hypothetical protein
MTAQTFTNTRAASTFPGPFQPIGPGLVCVAYADYAIPETPEVGDIYQLCRLPKGAVPLGGYFAATDIDTGTETLDIDLGIAANGVDSADPDFFCNSGVLSGDAIATDLPLTNASNLRLINFTTLTTLGAETIVQAVVNAVAQAGGTGRICVVIYYVVG